MTVTVESLFEGEILIRQSTGGYRFTIDPVLLAHFVKPLPGDRVVDLGTGSGIMPLILAFRHPHITLAAVEIQKGLADLAAENIGLNGFSKRIALFHGDMTDPELRSSLGTATHVISNPPYTRYKSGRVNPYKEKALARHEITITLSALIETASSLLESGGFFDLIYPRERLDELFESLRCGGFAPVRLRLVHPLKGGPARRVLVESVKGKKGGLRTEPPLFIFLTHDVYSDEVAKMFNT